MTNNEVILEPPSTIEKIRTLIITMICLVITLFIAVFIFLLMDLKKMENLKKAPVFPYQYDKIEKSLIKNWTSRDKLYKPNGIIILKKSLIFALLMLINPMNVLY